MLQAQFLRQSFQTIDRRPSGAPDGGALTARIRHWQERQVTPERIFGTVREVFRLVFLADGIGWIALAITIFGGWNPLRAAFGAYLFAFLQWLGLVLQSRLPGVPTQVLQVAPFPLMILTLLLVNISDAEWVSRMLAAMPERTRRWMMKLLRALRASPPASLGVPFESE